MMKSLAEAGGHSKMIFKKKKKVISG